MEDERSERGRNWDGQREYLQSWGEKTMGDRICKVVDGIYIGEHGQNAHIVVHLIRMTDGEICHEVGASAL